MGIISDTEITRRANRAVIRAISPGPDRTDDPRAVWRRAMAIFGDPDNPKGKLGDTSAREKKKMLGQLARALRIERNRARAGHWSYDLNRHLALLEAYADLRRDDGKPESRERPQSG